MPNTNAFQSSMLSTLGRQAGFSAFKYRRKEKGFYGLERLLDQWSKIFSLGEVAVFAVGVLALFTLDIFFMMPIYRQVSQIVSGDPDLLKLQIGIGINILGLITGEKLAKCSVAGSFYRWEVWKQGDGETDTAILNLSFTRPQRVAQFLILFLIYVTVILALVWMRSVLISDTQSALEKVELQMSIIGMFIALFAVTIGGYLFPFFQYLIWKISMEVACFQMELLIKRVSERDLYIHSLWKQTGMPTDNSQDVKEALVRFLFRTKGLGYCDPVTEQELQLLQKSMTNWNHPSLPE